MCLTPIFWWPPLWASLWLAGSATTWAYRWSAAAARWPCKRPSSPLLTLHVQTLRLNQSAGKRPPYRMRAPRLHLVKPD